MVNLGFGFDKWKLEVREVITNGLHANAKEAYVLAVSNWSPAFFLVFSITVSVLDFGFCFRKLKFGSCNIRWSILISV